LQPHIVKLENDLLVCSCKESLFEGLACRHELCVYVKGNKAIENIYVHQRWLESFFDVSKLPQILKETDEEEEKSPRDFFEERKEASESNHQAIEPVISFYFLLLTF